MKKVLLLITMLLSVCIVKAATLKDLNLMWENSEVGNIQYVEKQGTSYYVYSQNGIFRFYDSSKQKYDKYSIEGTYLFKKENNQILLFISKENQSAFKIIDYNFNEIKSVNLDFRRFAYYEKTNDGYIFIGNTYPYGLKYFKTDKDLKITDSGSIVTPAETYLGGIANGKIYFRTNYPHYYYVYDNGFSEISAEEYSNAHPTDYNIWQETSGQHQQTNNEISQDLYNRIMAKYPAPTDKTSTSAQILKDGENYVVLYMGRDSHWSANETYIHRELKLVYYDKNLNEKWHKTFPEWNSGEEICGRIEDNSYIGFSNGNIILLSNEREEQIFNVYDRSGNLLKDFKDKLHPSREYRPMYVDLVGDSLFLVYDREFVFCFEQDSINKVFPTLLANEDYGALTPTRIYYFAVTYNIKTVVKGKGNIQISQSVAGKNDEVTFTITPEEGYVLGEVRVTDANGKTVVFKNNTFTMPSADVTIEAVFLPVKNPETKDIVIISISILAILAASIVFLNRKKIKEIS